ncbi:RNI-like protein [Coccomyxa subellipsoidea C-169]|uniref:RNI-like protein n=1 Tax=Coccomyxa subellipsoidea (strain C-169) TaxID=574566 RepID=I0YW44_COCSC|nr:RNI-like protein [Coccomyxa subellipsoidea C-169]EIE22613.1 RNI-like protein [Coccomyxa subellipsoidea C-169]|eukprot:XP_005647157.1 RNI-like protein [Coccomyxa subellipsoidea C-169]
MAAVLLWPLLSSAASALAPSDAWHQILQHPSLWNSLDLRGSQNPEPALQHISDSHVAAEALRNVVLEFAVGIEDRHLQQLERYNLEEINLNGCQKVTDRGVAELVRACPSLTAISLYWNLNVGVETLKALSEACPRLSQVNLSGCKAVTDLGIVQLAQGCPQLTHVDLTRCTRLGDTAYTALAKHCPNIEVLRMYASMPSALAIQGCGALSHLRVIDLCGAHAATDAAVGALGACHELREVNLTWCIQLTDAGICALGQGCRKLESLSLHGIRGVTDAAIQALAESCSESLHTLDTSGCTGIVQHDRARLKQLFPNLRCFVVHS